MLHFMVLSEGVSLPVHQPLQPEYKYFNGIKSVHTPSFSQRKNNKSDIITLLSVWILPIEMLILTFSMTEGDGDASPSQIISIDGMREGGTHPLWCLRSSVFISILWKNVCASKLGDDDWQVNHNVQQPPLLIPRILCTSPPPHPSKPLRGLSLHAELTPQTVSMSCLPNSSIIFLPKQSCHQLTVNIPPTLLFFCCFYKVSQ